MNNDTSLHRSLAARPASSTGGIYFHIPFCKRRCVYCDFFSSTDSGKKAAYVQALCRELELRQDYLNGQPVQTVYFGGGTPSQLSADDFGKLFDTLYRLFPISPEAEITLEANPDDLTEDYLSSLKPFPFNRLSMGIQTFHDDTLRLLHRRHTAAQAVEAFHRCRDAGIGNLSIDLMYGLPGETIERWEADLRQALELAPEHISAYHLIYEEGTALWRLREQHQVAEADEELSLTLYRHLVQRLKENGYEHYEISNFCRPGRFSRHNSSYWDGTPYLGCGAAAHSYNGMARQANVASIDGYIAGIRQGSPDVETEPLDLATRYNDCIVTALRTCWGVSLPLLTERFGKKLADYCLRMAQPHLQRGTLELLADHLKLTERGVFVSDDILSDLLWVEA